MNFEVYGKCREYAEKLCSENPDLSLVRGTYECPIWGPRHHWWAKDSDGKIVDPTATQFPSAGFGRYVEYDGTVECEYCGKTVREEDMHRVDQHMYCSYECYGRDVGF